MTSIGGVVLITFGLFLALIVAQFAGHAIGKRRVETIGKDALSGYSAVAAPVFALLGLLIAFTFSGASSRFDTRRALVVDQVNALGTAWMRADLLPPPQRDEARDLLRRYVSGLRDAAASGENREAVASIVPSVLDTQDKLWQVALQGVDDSEDPYVATLLLPALNQVFDLSTARLASSRTHVQSEVVVFLFLLALFSAAIAGISQARAPALDSLHAIVLATIISLAIYVILDLEFPNIGLITLDAGQALMEEFRTSIGQ